MAKMRVLSVEELLARKELVANGQNPDSATEVLALRNKLATAEQALAEKDKKPTTAAEIRKTLDSLLEYYQVEPAEELLKIVMEKRDDGRFVMSTAERVEIWQGFMRYRNPQLKAVEMTGKVDHVLNITVMDYSTKVVVDQRTQIINREGE